MYEFVLHPKEKRYIYFRDFLIVILKFFYEEEEDVPFDEGKFFDDLIRSPIYRGYSWTHSRQDKAEHGPFDIQKISPRCYDRIILFENLTKEFEWTLLSFTIDEIKKENYVEKTCYYYERTVGKLIAELKSCTLFFELKIPLHSERYWSETYREVPYLDLFKEWIAIDTENRQVYMIHILQD